MNEFQVALLESHNRRREEHGVPPLQWDEEIAQQSQVWADKLADEEDLYHATKEERNWLGENLANNLHKTFSGEEATQQWYGEIQHFDYEDCAEFDTKTGHFTQVIWKNSVKVGAAIATSKTGKHYVCARYQPPGNVRGSFEENLQILDEVEEEYENEDGETSTRIVKKVRERQNKKEEEEDKPARPDVEIGIIKHSSKMQTEEGDMSFDYLYQRLEKQKGDDLLRKTVEVISYKLPRRPYDPAYLRHQNNYLNPGKSYVVTQFVH